jgi:hypothetical protein
MKKLIFTLSILIFVFSGCTGTCDPFGGTRETKMKTYLGDPGAKEVYITQHSPKTGRTAKQGCTTAGCTYSVMERVMVHNPTSRKVNVDVLCQWFLKRASSGEYAAAKNSRKGVAVDAHASRGVEIQQMITLSQELAIGIEARCSMSLRP